MSKRNPNISIHSHRLDLRAEPARIQAARRGEVIHHALGALGLGGGRELGPVVDPVVLERAVRRGFAILDLDPGQWRIQEDFVGPLVKVFAIPQFRAWFGKDATSLEEADIVDPAGAVHRPDRVVLGAGKVEIIDFKVGKREDSHRDQLKTYMNLLKAVFDGTQIAGYLVYIDEPAIAEVT